MGANDNVDRVEDSAGFPGPLSTVLVSGDNHLVLDWIRTWLG